MENLRGIALMVAAMAGFALEDAFIKAAAVTMPPGQILMMLGLMGGTLFALAARAQGVAVINPAFFQRGVVLRNLAEMVGTFGMVMSIALLPLSIVSSILQAMPLVITMGAALFLGEAVGWRRWSAVAVGFFGVLLIVQPGGAEFDPNIFWPLLAVLGLGARDLAVRRVPKSVPHILLAVYGFGAVVPVGMVQLAVSGGAVWPDARLWGLLCAGVAFGVVAYYLLVSATRIGDVSVITPFRYSRLLFALIIGIAVFGERPDLATYAGSALIIGSGIYTFVRERRLARRRPLDPTLV